MAIHRPANGWNLKRVSTHPGEMLREEFLGPLNISQNALAMKLRVPATRIGEIVKGKRAISVAGSDLGQSDNSDSDRQVKATRGKRLQGLQSGFSLVDTGFDLALQHEDPTLHDFGRYKVVRQRVLLGKWNANVQMRFGLF